MSATRDDVTLLLTAKQAAAALAISPRKLWSLTNAGEVKAVKIGRVVRYRPEHLREYIDGIEREGDR